MSDIDKAERLGRKRAGLLVGLGLILLLQLALSFYVPIGLDDRPLRSVDVIRLVGWCVVVLACLFALVTGGGYGFGKNVRNLVNDETARANRDVAVRFGFVAAMLVSLVLFIASFFQLVDLRLASQVVNTVGLASGMIRFGMLEKREYRRG